MSLGYDTNSETLTGTIDVYANHIDTQTLTINGVNISGNVSGPTGPIGPAGAVGPVGQIGPVGPVAPQIKLFDEAITSVSYATLPNNTVAYTFYMQYAAYGNNEVFAPISKFTIPKTFSGVVSQTFQITMYYRVRSTEPSGDAFATLKSVTGRIKKNGVVIQTLPAVQINITKKISYVGTVDTTVWNPDTYTDPNNQDAIGKVDIETRQNYGTVTIPFSVSASGGTGTDIYQLEYAADTELITPPGISLSHSGVSTTYPNTSNYYFNTQPYLGKNELGEYIFTNNTTTSVTFESAAIPYVAASYSLYGSLGYPTGAVVVNNLISVGDIYYKGQLLAVGTQGPIGPEGPQGQKGDNGSDASVLGVELEIAAVVVSVVAVAASVVALTTSLATVQGEVGALSAQEQVLANNTKFITSTYKTNVASQLDVNNGISNTISLNRNGTIDATKLDCKKADIVYQLNAPEIATTNITPYTSFGGVINLATSGLGETVNIGNRTSKIYLNGDIIINRSLASDAFNIQGFVNQWF